MIKNMVVSRRFIIRRRLTGKIYRCVETIKFICESCAYSFSALVEINPQAAAQPSELLAE